MPTLQEVANKAGVSIATVSKVLSNTPYFTEDTRRKVMEAVEELGYIPNLAARALSSGKTNIIAVVFPYIYDAVFSDPFVLYILEGIESVCRDHGYNLLLSTPQLTNEEGVDKSYIQLLRSGYLEGIIALDNVPIASVIEPANELGIPAIAIGSGEHTYHVYCDDFIGGKTLMNHVLELGHRHIGIIQSPIHLNLPVQRRIEGFLSELEDMGIDSSRCPFVEGNFSIESGAKAAQQLLDQNPDLTALVCVNDRMAMGAIQYAQQNGYPVPTRLTVVGYDDIPSARFFSPSITTINQYAPEIGRKAAQMLFAVLDGKEPESVVLPIELMVRESSAPLTNPESSGISGLSKTI